jgi:hypothetical protein
LNVNAWFKDMRARFCDSLRHSVPTKTVKQFVFLLQKKKVDTVDRSGTDPPSATSRYRHPFPTPQRTGPITPFRSLITPSKLAIISQLDPIPFLHLDLTSFAMTQNAIDAPIQSAKTILLYTGNIMIDGARAGFLNTSMSKNNAEVCHSLRVRGSVG